MFLRRRLFVPASVLGSADATETGTKPVDIAAADRSSTALSVCGSNTRRVKGNAKTSKMRGRTHVFSMSTIGTFV